LNIPGGKQGANYYFLNAVRFSASNYVPTKEDVLIARKKTSCVSETFFDINSHKFSFVDVGGQRSERKNWLSVFQDTTAIIYLCSIADYDLILEESPDTNRFAESLRLWKSITAYKVFKDTPFILFLNKSDLFEEKIKRVPLSDYFETFPEFSKSPENAKLSECEKSWRFLLEQFTRGCEVKYYHHLTNSLNTELTKKIFAHVQTSIWSERMNTLM
jgi:GTPase SAR1 family protein